MMILKPTPTIVSELAFPEDMLDGLQALTYWSKWTEAI